MTNKAASSEFWIANFENKWVEEQRSKERFELEIGWHKKLLQGRIKDGMTCLDLGCGAGAALVPLRQLNATGYIAGVDGSSGIISVARKNLEGYGIEGIDLYPFDCTKK